MGRDSLQTEAAPTLTCPPLIGACGCALGLFWFILFYDDPKDHPCISVDEKEFITSSLVAQVSSSGQSLPIKAMLKSLPLWAISLGCFAFSWTNYVMFLYSPTFISSKLHVNVTEVGYLLFSWLCETLLISPCRDSSCSSCPPRTVSLRFFTWRCLVANCHVNVGCPERKV